MMTTYDIARIENAIWVLGRYWNELQDTDTSYYINGVKFTPSDALKVLDIALYLIRMEKKNSEDTE